MLTAVRRVLVYLFIYIMLDSVRKTNKKWSSSGCSWSQKKEGGEEKKRKKEEACVTDQSRLSSSGTAVANRLDPPALGWSTARVVLVHLLKRKKKKENQKKRDE